MAIGEGIVMADNAGTYSEKEQGTTKQGKTD
jgi:hypothetical protein